MRINELFCRDFYLSGCVIDDLCGQILLKFHKTVLIGRVRLDKIDLIFLFRCTGFLSAIDSLRDVSVDEILQALVLSHVKEEQSRLLNTLIRKSFNVISTLQCFSVVVNIFACHDYINIFVSLEIICTVGGLCNGFAEVVLINRFSSESHSRKSL